MPLYGTPDYVHSLRFAIPPHIIPTEPGSAYWDEDDKTLALVMPDGVTLQVGQETQIIATNRTGAKLLNGKPVYISGAQGNRVTVALADADACPAWCVIGMTTQDIENNQSGKITVLGMVRDLDTSAFAEGATLYLGTTPGELVDAAPGYPATRWLVGYVARSHEVNGSIFVAPQRLSPYVRREASVHVEPGENAAQPTLGNWVDGNMQVPHFPGAATTKRMYFYVDFDHDLVQGEDLDVHLHLGPTTEGAGNYRFGVYWQWGQSGAVWQAAQLIPAVGAAGGVAWADQELHFSIPSSGQTYTSRLLFQIFRDPTHADDNYADPVGLLSANCHYIADPLQAG
jgi:hypothetical protein